MKTTLHAFAVAAGLFVTAATAATLNPIPVTISGSIDEACSTSTTGLDFAFGNVRAKTLSSVSEEIATVSVNCTAGTEYSFSTSLTEVASSYLVKEADTPGTPGTPDSTADGFPGSCIGEEGDPNVQPNGDFDPSQPGSRPVTCNVTTTGTPGTPGTTGATVGEVFLAVLDAGSYTLFGDAAAIQTGSGTDQDVTIAARLQEAGSDGFDVAATIPNRATLGFASTNANLYVNY